MEDKPKFAFVGNSHMAFWALNVYFPQWECLNYGAPGEGLAYVESFHEDTSDCQVVIQFGSNDIYQLNEENTDALQDIQTSRPSGSKKGTAGWKERMKVLLNEITPKDLDEK